MVKKEFLSLLKPTLQRFSLLLMIPFAYILKTAGVMAELTPQVLSGFLLGIYITVVVWVAANYGLDVFKEEHTDGAFEYLFTFPLRKMRIIFTKLYPRMAVISGLTCFMVLLWHPTISHRFIGSQGVWFLLLWILVMNQLFLFGYFISFIFSKQLRLGLFILVVFSYGTLIAAGETLLTANDNPNNYLLYMNIIALLILLSLFLISRMSMRKIDLSTVEAYGKRFTVRSLTVFLLLDGFGLLIILS